MRQTYLFFTAAALAGGFGLALQPAYAQSSPSGNMKQPVLQPQSQGDQSLPPAVPGAGDENITTAPSVAKQQTGDPTAELFTAINGNDYNSAQDAISRGADLGAQNALGETPIDLSVGLNRNSITFMLLAARNDGGGGSIGSGQMPAIPVASYSATAARAAAHASGKPPAVSVKLIETPSAAPSNSPGTPNPSAGFLGFGK
jgi:hypothetical protein